MRQIRGRTIREEDLKQIRSWVEAHPNWSRRRLSQEVVQWWDWRTASGQLKDMATREVLNRLEAAGLIRLPTRQRRGGRQIPRAVIQAEGEQGELALEERWPPVRHEALSELAPLSWEQARPGQRARALVARYLSQHHYLGYPNPLGQIHYLVRDGQGREVACLLFGPASWKVAARDQFIGWSSVQRQAGLAHVANNSRFLILPWVQTPHLASHLLAGAARRLRRDWRAQNGVGLWLLETFVEQSRFAGTCYRAANWLQVGQSQGRTRNDRWHERQVPIKDVYLMPLVADFRRRLGVG